jgi:hypothetical protein
MLNVILVVALVIFLLAIGPFLVIWSVLEWKAVLVNGADPWTLNLWCATVLLGAFLRANVTVKRKD